MSNTTMIEFLLGAFVLIVLNVAVVGIVWIFVNPVTAIERALTIFGSILTFWIVLYILSR